VGGEAEVLEDPRELCVAREADGHKLLELLVPFLSPGSTPAEAAAEAVSESGGGGGGRGGGGGGAAVVALPTLAFAKVSSFGPALAAISKAKLQWLHASSADLRVPVTSSPLGLRDGSVIVVCDQLELKRFVASAAAGVGAEQDAVVLQKKPNQKRPTIDSGVPRREAATHSQKTTI
jgi:hypothetical protein